MLQIWGNNAAAGLSQASPQRSVVEKGLMGIPAEPRLALLSREHDIVSIAGIL